MYHMNYVLQIMNVFILIHDIILSHLTVDRKHPANFNSIHALHLFPKICGYGNALESFGLLFLHKWKSKALPTARHYAEA